MLALIPQNAVRRCKNRGDVPFSVPKVGRSENPRSGCAPTVSGFCPTLCTIFDFESGTRQTVAAQRFGGICTICTTFILIFNGEKYMCIYIREFRFENGTNGTWK